MRILHNDHIVLIVLDDLVIFVADSSCAELNKVSEVGVIVKYLPDRFGTPHMSCTARIWLAELCIVVIWRYRHTVLIKLISNMMRTVTNGNAPQRRPSLRSGKQTDENSTLSGTLREDALMLLCIILVSTDYGIYHNAECELCGIGFVCTNRLSFVGYYFLRIAFLWITWRTEYLSILYFGFSTLTPWSNMICFPVIPITFYPTYFANTVSTSINDLTLRLVKISFRIFLWKIRNMG